MGKIFNCGPSQVSDMDLFNLKFLSFNSFIIFFIKNIPFGPRSFWKGLGHSEHLPYICKSSLFQQFFEKGLTICRPNKYGQMAFR